MPPSVHGRVVAMTGMTALTAAAHQVPGTYQDAVNPNTKLGKVVKAACEELDTLGKMVRTRGATALPHAGVRAGVHAVCMLCACWQECSWTL
jgi:hypothetical protein